MPKHIIIADSAIGAGRKYIASSKRGVTTTDVTDAALFASEDAATSAVRELLTKDFERKNDVTLLLGTVTFTVTTTKPVARKAAATGWVLRRATGDYYRGPKTRPPRDFRDAYYNYVANRDAATVFPSQVAAVTCGEACLEILRKTAEDELRSSNPSTTYKRIHDEFRYLVEAL